MEALRAFDKLAPGLYSKNTLLYGVEVKFYSSKISVKKNFETDVQNLYAIGDALLSCERHRDIPSPHILQQQAV